jgi:3-oxoacid CoA-transferase subunit A
LRCKIYAAPSEAAERVLFDGMTIMSRGFGLSESFESLIPEVRRSGVRNLTIISNGAGANGFGLRMLLKGRQSQRRSHCAWSSPGHD